MSRGRDVGPSRDYCCSQSEAKKIHSLLGGVNSLCSLGTHIMSHLRWEGGVMDLKNLFLF